MINPVWLRSFCVLVEEGHFTRTADRLHMTQSGVSQQVRKLEEYLGVALLDRQGKQFTLTDAGGCLYKEAQEIVQALSDLAEKVAADPTYEGNVRLMSPGSVGLKIYPKLLALQKRHPGLAIDYRFAPNSDVERYMVEYNADIGLMTRPSSLPEVNSRPMASEELLLVTPFMNNAPDWQELLTLGYIGHPDGHHHASLLLGANYSQFLNVSMFAQRGFSNQISLILEPVSMGLGFTVLPAHAVRAFHHPKLISAHRLENPVNETLYLITRRHRNLPARMNMLVGEIRRWL
ncbi:LysR family transcriptional regulator [Microbulbifer sp. OS29]|uniref:LysR family transcriptional regulator n=1 Tax=Microbulbifer okhotskensis TaxID=2926617 RepID=A0A9X2J3P7_9GAMM|nr:LysR family transcriptional regulator [Microbulbifer okhotskensis]MCO1333747.1 LysR family transcriptional regulator [Microbulbifer okhotskensis]